MTSQTRIGLFALVLLACTSARAGEYAPWQSPQPSFFHRLAPAGGYNPGGGLIHWWNPYCYPPRCGPDLYCRKPFPNVCRNPCVPVPVPVEYAPVW